MHQQVITYNSTGVTSQSGRVAGYHVYADGQRVGMVSKRPKGWYALGMTRNGGGPFATRDRAGEWLGRQVLSAVD